MQLSTAFAWRYFRTKRTTHAINIIAWISVAAIAVVTAALIVVMSVFNGFEDLVKSLYGDFYTDIRIEPSRGKFLHLDSVGWPAMARQAGVQQWYPVVQERAVLVNDDNKTMAWLKGVPQGYDAAVPLPSHLAGGEYNLGDSAQPALLLGNGLENALLVRAGETAYPITVYLPNSTAAANADLTDALLSANVYPTGSFAIQQEFDNQYAFTHIGFLRYMLGIGHREASAIEVKVPEGMSPDRLARQWQQQMGGTVQVKTRYQQNQSLFAAMQMEKLIIFGVAFLILLIAAFNIISALTMTVLEKQQDIAVLAAMGAGGPTIGQVYLKLAAMMAGAGGVIGFAIGLLICLGQQRFHWVKLGGQSFIIDHYPVSLRAGDFAVVGGIIMLVALLAGYFPARRAATTRHSLR